MYSRFSSTIGMEFIEVPTKGTALFPYSSPFSWTVLNIRRNREVLHSIEKTRKIIKKSDNLFQWIYTVGEKYLS